MFPDDIFIRISSHATAWDLVKWRLVSKKFKTMVDARLVGPFMMYATNAQLIRVKNAVPWSDARRLGQSLRYAQTVSADIARFIVELRPLTGFDRVQRIGEYQHISKDKIICEFLDEFGNQRQWQELTSVECDGDGESESDVVCCITIPFRLFRDPWLCCFTFFPGGDLVDWAVSIECQGLDITWAERSIHGARCFTLPADHIEYGKHGFRGEYAALITNLELVRLALLHESIVLKRPRDADIIFHRMLDILGI